MNRSQNQLLADLESARELLDQMATQIISPILARDAMKARAEAVTQAIEMLTIIDRLREEEGDGVMFVSDNADFNGLPNCMVICNAEFTTWCDKAFHGDTVIECLRAALEAKNERIRSTDESLHA